MAYALHNLRIPLLKFYNKKITYINDSGRKILQASVPLLGLFVHDVFKVCNYYTDEPYNPIIDEVFKSLKPSGLKTESALIDFNDNRKFSSVSLVFL